MAPRVEGPRTVMRGEGPAGVEEGGEQLAADARLHVGVVCAISSDDQSHHGGRRVAQGPVVLRGRAAQVLGHQAGERDGDELMQMALQRHVCVLQQRPHPLQCKWQNFLFTSALSPLQLQVSIVCEMVRLRLAISQVSQVSADSPVCPCRKAQGKLRPRLRLQRLVHMRCCPAVALILETVQAQVSCTARVCTNARWQGMTIALGRLHWGEGAPSEAGAGGAGI